MKLDIRGVSDQGDIEKERVVLRANSDVDIGRYVLTRNDYVGDGSVSSEQRSSFWLPDQTVDAGNLVVVYTKSGEDRIRVNKDGSRTHFLYSGGDRAIWRDGDAVVLMEVSSWQLKKV